MAITPPPVIIAGLTQAAVDAQIDQIVKVAPASISLKPWKTKGRELRILLKNIVQFATEQAGTGAAVNTHPNILAVLALRDTNALVAGEYYKFPFQSVQFIPQLVGVSGAASVRICEPETLTVKAKSENEFEPFATSEEHPDDDILFSFHTSEVTDFTLPAAFATSYLAYDVANPTTVHGRIYYRRDKIRNNAVWGYDFRQFVFPRWDALALAYNAGTTYYTGDLAIFSDDLYVSVYLEPSATAGVYNSAHVGQTPNTFASKYWHKILNDVSDGSGDLKIFTVPESVILGEWKELTGAAYSLFYTFNTMNRNADTTLPNEAYLTDNVIRDHEILGTPTERNPESDHQNVFGSNIVIALQGSGEGQYNNRFGDNCTWATMVRDDSGNNSFEGGTADLVVFGGLQLCNFIGLERTLVGWGCYNLRSYGYANEFNVFGAGIHDNIFQGAHHCSLYPDASFNELINSHRVRVGDDNQFNRYHNSSGIYTPWQCIGNEFYNSTGIFLDVTCSQNIFRNCSSFVLGDTSEKNTFEGCTRVELGEATRNNTMLGLNIFTCTNGSAENNFFSGNFNAVEIVSTMANNLIVGSFSNCVLSMFMGNNISGSLSNVGAVGSTIGLIGCNISKPINGLTKATGGNYNIENTTIAVPVDFKVLNNNIDGKNIALKNGAGDLIELTITGTNTLGAAVVAEFS
jgi:hypothetical protein